jgi:hypothetical protein
VSPLRSTSGSSTEGGSGTEHMSHCDKQIRQRYAHELNRVECIVIYCFDYDCTVVRCYFLILYTL